MGWLKNTFDSFKFWFKRNESTICFAGGCVGMAVGIGLVVKGTLDIKETLEKDKEDIKAIKDYAEKYADKEDSDYTSAEYRKDIVIAYGNTALDVGKRYLPAVIAFIASVFLFNRGYSSLKARNIALVASLSLVTKEFEDYRQNVRDRFGERVDEELRFGIKPDDIVLDASGNTVGWDPAPEDMNIYLESTKRIFDRTSSYFDRNPDVNFFNLKIKEREANELLRIRKFMFLNDVYDLLDLPKCKAGQYLGWVYDPNVEHKISFGSFLASRAELADYDVVATDTYGIPLEMNVDGDIIEIFEEYQKKSA